MSKHRIVVLVTVLLFLLSSCAGTSAQNILPEDDSVLPSNETAPSVLPSIISDERTNSEIEESGLNDPYSEDEIREIAEYLYQYIGVESYFWGSQTTMERLIGKSSNVEIYCLPFEPFGTEYWYIIHESVGPVSDLDLEEAYIMIILYHYPEAKKTDQIDSPTDFRGSIEEYWELIENHQALYNDMTYIGQCSISFTYNDKPEYMYTFSYRDEMISMLKEEISEEFILFEGPVTHYEPYREDVDVCIVIDEVRYYGHFRYYWYDCDGEICGKLIYLAEDEERNTHLYTLPREGSYDDDYLQRIVDFNRKTIIAPSLS